MDGNSAHLDHHSESMHFTNAFFASKPDSRKSDNFRRNRVTEKWQFSSQYFHLTWTRGQHRPRQWEEGGEEQTSSSCDWSFSPADAVYFLHLVHGFIYWDGYSYQSSWVRKDTQYVLQYTDQSKRKFVEFVYVKIWMLWGTLENEKIMTVIATSFVNACQNCAHKSLTFLAFSYFFI